MKEVSFSRTVKEVRFGAWTLDPKLQKISDGEVERELEPLLFKILCYLIINNEQIITRQNLVEDVWCQNYVDDNAINRAMSELRKVLKSNKQRGLVVKTHYRKGYSFFLSAEVLYFDKQTEVINTVTPSNQKSEQNSPISLISPLIRIALFGGFTAVLGLLFLYFYKTNEQLDNHIESVQFLDTDYEEQILSWMNGEYSNVFASPDEKLVAFSFIPATSKNKLLIVKDLNSGLERKLGLDKHSVYPIGWDEDSSAVFYRVEGVDDFCEIWSTSADLESGGIKLFDCTHKVARGVGIDDGHFIYSKYNYRGRDQLSAVTYRTLDNGNEFQLSSPNLNSYGDSFLLYEPSIGGIFFMRLQYGFNELYMTDLDGSGKTKLYESSSYFRELKYVESTNSITWFDNRSNQIYSYSLAKQALESITQLPLDTVTYLDHSFISDSKIVATTFPHEQSIYTVSLTDKALAPLINEKYIDIKAVRADDDVFFLRVLGDDVVVMHGQKYGSGYRYTKFSGGKNQDLLYEPKNKLLILKVGSSIKIFNTENELIDEINEQGVITDVNVLQNGDIGYILVKEGQVDSQSYVYSVSSKRKSLLPIKNNVWFNKDKNNRLVYLTSDDRLKSVNLETREEYVDTDFPTRVQKHLIVMVGEHFYYANRNTIYRLVDGAWEVFKQLDGIVVIHMSYSSQHNQLVLGTLKRKKNQLVMLDINEAQQKKSL
ncbi:winged helix-turn-helix domain-containing protein [Pseudoalteromonas luteoviolacea]|uniref:winged helix-turn-helix domain-containing protein n=1 Tax=Pseudoalteromonas luteoviolacea TaxID=43657 RepID=UPI001EEE7B5E|nr:winged helix-turn-helix domain-containing protein [Pseudoalteromonas luteoviolacea]MCF6441949.1 winged helix-turn-helix domain-containing protein [Pseudoalteromonas luteoviolacea]